MAYYQGQSAVPVKPVTRRATFTRGQPPKNEKKFLQRSGRRPWNRPGYPSAGIPIATTPTTPALGAWTSIPMSMEPGRTIGHYLPLSMELDPGKQLGQDAPAGYGLAPLSLLQSTPAIPSVVTAPVKSTVWEPITSLLNLWDQRPQVLKDLRFKVDPNVAMRAAQAVVKPSQVTGFVDTLRSWGVMPSYQGIPVTGTTAGYGYQIAGMNIGQYLPWIIGGGAILILAPMLFGKRK